MHARRPSPRFNRGRVANAPLSNPLTIVGSTNTVAWWRSDLGITLNGSTVSAWADQTGNGFHLTQGAGAKQPTYSAGGGPNGVPALSFDGTDDQLDNAALNLPAPATTPTTFWVVLRQDVATAADRLWGAAGDNLILYTPAATNSLRMFNGVAELANTGIATNTFGRAECYFSGSANDYSRLKTTLVTGPNTGNNDPGAGFSIGVGFGAAAGWAICTFVEVVIFNKLLSAAEVTALNTYGSARYGSGVFV